MGLREGTVWDVGEAGRDPKHQTIGLLILAVAELCGGFLHTDCLGQPCCACQVLRVSAERGNGFYSLLLALDSPLRRVENH